ncbi:MAG: hypothetical protein R3351_06375, partial [Nitrospirales bacterium]|nr:hypothetical protein [Nitrospirales bacterium]
MTNFWWLDGSGRDFGLRVFIVGTFLAIETTHVPKSGEGGNSLRSRFVLCYFSVYSGSSFWDR